MSDKARELLEMVAAWKSKWPDADVIPLAEIELYAANLAPVPAPPAEPRVPREPTEAMVEAGATAWERHNHGSPYDAEIPDIWRAMYDAAPAAEPVAQQPPPTQDDDPRCARCDRKYRIEAVDFRLCCICERDLIAERKIGSGWANELLEATRDLAASYAELIYAVASKFPGETRHETALRYIRNAERGGDQCAKATVSPDSAASPTGGEG
jgi:hypothetical protein